MFQTYRTRGQLGCARGRGLGRGRGRGIERGKLQPLTTKPPSTVYNEQRGWQTPELYVHSSPLELNHVEDVSVASEGTGGANRAAEVEADEGVARGAPVRRVDHPPEVIEISTDEENDPGEDKDVDEDEEEDEEEDASDEDEDEEEGLCHPGYLEWDNNESWADWDEDCHGKMDTNAHRREYPEGFVWTCCGERGGESDGCEPGDLGDVDEMYPDSPKFSGADGKEKGDLYHSGDLDWEYNSTWDDWDERCHGEMDTNTHREEYPEGFVWSCCGERGGESDGCDTY